jgi:hypothetical protein
LTENQPFRWKNPAGGRERENIMHDLARSFSLALGLYAATAAQSAAAATQTASVNANVVKPLTLIRIQDLDLGTITLKPGTWSSATVGISRAGIFSCPSANAICTGLVQVAKYNVTGTNRGVVTINAPNVTMVNQTDPSKTLTLVVDRPGSVTLTNSGQPGITFPLGGSITLSSSTASGDYKGAFNVTVDYQ